MKTLIVASFKALESPFVHAKYVSTHCIRTIHVPNIVNYAFVILRIKSELHRNCSQLFHTCLQRNIGCCRGGELRDG